MILLHPERTGMYDHRRLTHTYVLISMGEAGGRGDGGQPGDVAHIQYVKRLLFMYVLVLLLIHLSFLMRCFQLLFVTAIIIITAQN